MKEVLSSATEAKLAGLFHKAKEACPMRITLEELGHPQPPTPLQTNNSTACGIANDTVNQRRSKAIDMRFYWIQDRVRQQQFFIYWRKGSINLADYFTKHHAPVHHIARCSHILHNPSRNRFALLASSESDTITRFPDTTAAGGSLAIHSQAYSPARFAASPADPPSSTDSVSYEGVLISTSGASPQTYLSRIQKSVRCQSLHKHTFKSTRRLSNKFM